MNIKLNGLLNSNFYWENLFNAKYKMKLVQYSISDQYRRKIILLNASKDAWETRPGSRAYLGSTRRIIDND